MAASGGELVADFIATTVPGEVAHPHGRNSFALENGVATLDPGFAKRASVDVEAVGERTASVVEREMYPIPTEEEARTLRKVADTIPYTAYMLCIVELAERASYYGVQTVFSNFMQYPLPAGGSGSGATPAGTQETPGALGKGEQFSVAMGLLFAFLAYVVPIGGGWVAEAKIGRFKTILIGVLVCGVSHIIMICGAIPAVLRAGHGIAPFMISLILLAIGAGLFKPNVAPTVLDQYQHQKAYTKYSEKYVGYWLAFLLPGIVYFLLPALLWFLSNRLIKHPPNGSVLNNVWKILAMAFKNNKGAVWKTGFFDSVKPSVLAEKGVTTFGGKQITWSDKDVEDVHRTMIACGVFLYFPIYNLNDGGIGSVSTSQGATMTTNGAPNDLLNNFNPLTIIVFIPILSYVVYPLLSKYKIRFGRITRITFGFSLAVISGIIGAIIQWRIYKTSPCGYQATNCSEASGTVSPISIWWQLPNYGLGAMSECFCNVTAYELAYARSPPGMKALVMSLFLVTTALSSALSEIITPAMVDPYLIWVWAGPTIALAVQTVIFWFRYRKFNDDDFMTYEDAPELNEKVFGEDHSAVDVPYTISEEEDVAPEKKQ
ncbi:hypothetical protein LTR36_006179 [Oleoguttula mirabilis]|uniref:Uncharacterized protein n=1 Tax=Oleoguttula mirabilis TaxID=1507867 RepID=A0AAV9JDC1_9PEZI|nr:hypothetical protein LTR36_006179 [Oleoguttula mirabilis]